MCQHDTFQDDVALSDAVAGSTQEALLSKFSYNH